jgi:hypothetical protein
MRVRGERQSSKITPYFQAKREPLVAEKYEKSKNPKRARKGRRGSRKGVPVLHLSTAALDAAIPEWVGVALIAD